MIDTMKLAIILLRTFSVVALLIQSSLLVGSYVGDPLGCDHLSLKSCGQ